MTEIRRDEGDTASETMRDEAAASGGVAGRSGSGRAARSGGASGDAAQGKARKNAADADDAAHASTPMPETRASGADGMAQADTANHETHVSGADETMPADTSHGDMVHSDAASADAAQADAAPVAAAHGEAAGGTAASDVHIEEQAGFEVFQHAYRAAIKEVRTKIEILSEDFAVHHDYNPIHHMERRLKTAESTEEKLRRLGKEISIESAKANIFDIAGIRVVCNFVEDVYTLADMLIAQNDVTLLVKKDYIANPKTNGYRSLHMVISVPVFLLDGCEDVPVEVQIRTVAMDFWASLEHQLRYKKTKQIPPKIDIELKACAEVSATLDRRMQKIFSELNQIE